MTETFSYQETGSSTVKRFSPEARQVLENENYFIAELQGESIESLEKKIKSRTRSKYFSFRPYAGDRDEYFQQTSRRSEVAVDPLKIYIPGSNFKSLDDQLAILQNYRDATTTIIPGVDVVIGDVADYAELCDLYEVKTGRNLFGQIKVNHGKNKWITPVYARTLTKVEHTHEGKSYTRFVEVSAQYQIRTQDPKATFVDNICVVPLIVPAAPNPSDVSAVA